MFQIVLVAIFGLLAAAMAGEYGGGGHNQG